MKTGIYSWFGRDIEMDERLRLIKSVGFDSVLLWWSEEYEHQNGPLAKQPELAAKHSLEIENVHLPYDKINLLWEDLPEGDEYEKYLSELIIRCGDYGIERAVLHVSRGDFPPGKTALGLSRFARIVECGAKRGVGTAIENLRRPDYMDFLYKNLGHENVGICFDSGHNNCYSFERDLLEEYCHDITALHLHDNDGRTDSHILPFDGSVNWTKTKELLEASSYSGALTLEVVAYAYPELSDEDFLLEARERLLKIYT